MKGKPADFLQRKKDNENLYKTANGYRSSMPYGICNDFFFKFTLSKSLSAVIWERAFLANTNCDFVLKLVVKANSIRLHRDR